MSHTLSYFKVDNLNNLTADVLRCYLLTFEGFTLNQVSQLLKVGLVNKVREAERNRNPVKQSPELVFGIDDELPKQNFSKFLTKNDKSKIFSISTFTKLVSANFLSLK